MDFTNINIKCPLIGTYKTNKNLVAIKMNILIFNFVFVLNLVLSVPPLGTPTGVKSNGMNL